MNVRWPCLLLLASTSSLAGPSGQNDAEAWFNSKSAAEVNEGSLTFLTEHPAKPLHHHQNKIRITSDSLTTGWTDLTQCHDNLDAVPRMQITFREGFIRELRVTESRLIGQAWIQGPTVQLREVSHGARLCLEAQTRALKNMGNGYFNLFNGPYMRKFLDGYYPMQVSMSIEYPVEKLSVIDVSPPDQSGFNMIQKPGQMSVTTIFEGELRTLIQFERKKPPEETGK